MNDHIRDLAKPPSLLEMIKTLNAASEDDIAFVTAAALNLYSESRRRIHGRILYTPADIRAIFAMIDTLLTDRSVDQFIATGRPRKLTSDEEKNLLNAIEETQAEGPVDSVAKDTIAAQFETTAADLRRR